MKLRRAGRGSPRALCLLSSRLPASRRRRNRVAALVRRPGASLRSCLLLFRRGISERPSALDRRRRTRTQGRIQNTPGRIVGARSRNAGVKRWEHRGVLQVSLRTGPGAGPRRLRGARGSEPIQIRIPLALSSCKNGIAIWRAVSLSAQPGTTRRRSLGLN